MLHQSCCPKDISAINTINIHLLTLKIIFSENRFIVGCKVVKHYAVL